MRFRKPDIVILALGFSLTTVVLLFPPWRAVGVSSTQHRPLLDDRAFALMRLGVSPDTGWVRVDTVNWGIPFAPIFDAPLKEDPRAEDEFKRRFEALASDSTLAEAPREARLLGLAEDYGKEQEARLARARIPERFRKQPLRTDTIAGQVYTVTRTDRFEFGIDSVRLTLTLGALAAGVAALMLGRRVWGARTEE